MTPEDKAKRGAALRKRREAMKAARAAIAPLAGYDPATINRADQGKASREVYEAYDRALDDYDRIRRGGAPRNQAETLAKGVSEAMTAGREADADGFLIMMDAAVKAGAPSSAIEALVAARRKYPTESRVTYWALVLAQALTESASK